MTEEEYQKRLQALRERLMKEKTYADKVHQRTRYNEDMMWQYEAAIGVVQGLEIALQIMEAKP